MSFLNPLYAGISLALEVAGVLFAMRALLIARTPQSAIAWSCGLVLFPIVTIPLFLIFGESRFAGYTLAGSNGSQKLDEAFHAIIRHLDGYRTSFTGKFREASSMANNLSRIPATSGAKVDLLINGEATFQAIFAAIDSAKESVWVQFFIIHDDRLGRGLADRLIAAARRGVECRVLFDQVGSKALPESWCSRLRAEGIHVERFVTNRQFGRRFQINFRNHRKLVIVDALVAFLGGLNVGDEYMGRSRRFGPWRDTHIRIEGPSVPGFQLSFLEDWNYTTGEVPPFRLPKPSVALEPSPLVIPIASGPAESWSICPAVYLSIINSATRRLWIASPYFVPGSPLFFAICHAAIRGVDVRIMLPQMADHLLPWLSSFTYYPKLRDAGVKLWRYQRGFMHQKVLLADDDISIVGSINVDYRSFMLNFELSAAIQDKNFAEQIEAMFLADFDNSAPEDLRKFEDGKFLFRLKCRAAALMSPEQ
jgi:cardiolipin synthase